MNKQIPVEKNRSYTLEITDLGHSGEGIGKIDDFTIFVPNGIPGDRLLVLIVKVKSHFAYGKLLDILEPSPARIEAKCAVSVTCGGCQIQQLHYDEQLKWKKQRVENTLLRIGKLENIQVEDVIGMKEPYYYRNKAQYPIRKEAGVLKIGFFAERSHRIVACDQCVIEAPINRQIIEIVRSFLDEYNLSIYDEATHKGLVKELIIRLGHYTKEVMVALVINGEDLPHKAVLVEALKGVSGMTSILLNINKVQTNVILGKETKLIWNQDFITDTIGPLKFKISLHAFFQVNPLQTQVLYQKALEFAGLTGKEVVWDAYCGTGTISLFLAQKAQKVYGVEIVPQAIENAKENAALNNIRNIKFFTGAAETVIPELYEKEGIVADTFVLDPPRKGCDQALLETILTMAPKRVVYVSCDPATLARDLEFLCNGGYVVEQVQPVDMFPQTTHVETVVLMSKVK